MALPGQILAPSQSSTIGPGTHIHGPNLCASIPGPIQHTRSSTKSNSPPTLSIPRPTGPLLPTVGTIILGKITRTTPRHATLTILALGPTGAHVLREPLPALIRQQDIRATEIDQVVVAESFRVGDVVRARVISLGDERSYYASTAGNELGVVLAFGEAGRPLVPVSWREVMDLETGGKEARKVAKVV